MNRHGAISENQWQWLRELSSLAPTYILLPTPSVLTKCLLLEGYVYRLSADSTGQISRWRQAILLKFLASTFLCFCSTNSVGSGHGMSLARDMLTSDIFWSLGQTKSHQGWSEFCLLVETSSRRGHMAPGWGQKPHLRVSFHYPVSRKLPPQRGQASHCTIPQLSQFRRVAVVSEMQL